jgi:hypothetical protein
LTVKSGGMKFAGPLDPTSWPNKLSFTTFNKSSFYAHPPFILVPFPPIFKFSSKIKGVAFKEIFEFTSLLSSTITISSSRPARDN